jgi:hypothetical protein
MADESGRNCVVPARQGVMKASQVVAVIHLAPRSQGEMVPGLFECCVQQERVAYEMLNSTGALIVLGHVSVQTTEPCLGGKPLSQRANDRIGLEPDPAGSS